MNPELLKTLPVVVFAPGDVVIQEESPLNGLYFLEDGEIEVRKAGILIHEIEQQGAVFGEMSWLIGSLPTATVKAVRECRFRHVADPVAFCSAHPEVPLFIARTLAKRLDSLARYMVSVKEQFKDREDHLGILDEVLDSLLHKHPREIPRRDTGD